MRRLTILQGLPASGKSTYAREHVDAHTVTVSMDGIRRMLVAGGNVQKLYYRGVRHDHPRIERDVVDMYRMMCARLLASGFDVIADAQNLGRDSQEGLIAACAPYVDDVRVVVFNPPLRVLLDRNRRRDGSDRVPESYIRDQYARWERTLRDEDAEWVKVPVVETEDGRWTVCDDGTPGNHVFIQASALYALSKNHDLAAVNGFVWEHPDALTDYDEIRF